MLEFFRLINILFTVSWPNTYLAQDTKEKKSTPGPLQPGSDTKQKKKRAPGSLRLGSDTKKKKRDQTKNKRTWPTLTWVRYQGKKIKYQAHSNLAQIPRKKKRAPVGAADGEKRVSTLWRF